MPVRSLRLLPNGILEFSETFLSREAILLLERVSQDIKAPFGHIDDVDLVRVQRQTGVCRPVLQTINFFVRREEF